MQDIINKEINSIDIYKYVDCLVYRESIIR